MSYVSFLPCFLSSAPIFPRLARAPVREREGSEAGIAAGRLLWRPPGGSGRRLCHMKGKKESGLEKRLREKGSLCVCVRACKTCLLFAALEERAGFFLVLRMGFCIHCLVYRGRDEDSYPLSRRGLPVCSRGEAVRVL